MAQNPFELQQPLPQQFGGMVQITPQQEGQVAGGSEFALSPEAMQMMWAPQPQQQFPMSPQPQINPLM